jgi:hypothetical protein
MIQSKVVYGRAEVPYQVQTILGYCLFRDYLVLYLVGTGTVPYLGTVWTYFSYLPTYCRTTVVNSTKNVMKASDVSDGRGDGMPRAKGESKARR